MTAALEHALREHGLGSFEAAIAGLARGSLRLRPAAAEPGLESRFGGVPRLAAGVEWPRRDSGPLSAVAQIALDDVAATAAAAAPAWLPRSGTLTFFYDLDDQPWGDDPQDADAARILYDPAPLRDLAPAEPPADMAPDLLLPSNAIAFERELTLPSPESDLIDALGLTDEQLDALDEVRKTLAGGTNPELVPVHRMFGHPELIQGSFDVGAGECELVLQLSSDEALGVELGDVGRLYFLVPAAAGSFDERLGGARAVVEEY